MNERSSPDIAGALKLAYHELKLHDADYHHRTSVEVNNKIVDVLAAASRSSAATEYVPPGGFGASHEQAFSGTPDAAQPSGGIAAIAAERRRQIEIEGWTPEHDANHDMGEMATAAAVYALHPFRWHFVVEQRSGRRLLSLSDFWPWDSKWFKPEDRRRNLVKAGALIAAEIDRLDRASTLSSTERSSD